MRRHYGFAGENKSGNMVKEGKKYIPEEEVRVYNEEGRFYGIYKYRPEDGRFLPVKMFMEN